MITLVEIKNEEELEIFRSALEKLGKYPLFGYTAEYDGDDEVSSGYMLPTKSTNKNGDFDNNYILTKTIDRGEELITLEEFLNRNNMSYTDKKEEVLYHIFRVYDYKGGELNENLNLTFDEFVEEIKEMFALYYEDDEEINKCNSYGEVEDYVYGLDIDSKLYAGSGSPVYSCYYTHCNSNELLPKGSLYELIIEDICKYKGIKYEDG